MSVSEIWYSGRACTRGQTNGQTEYDQATKVPIPMNKRAGTSRNRIDRREEVWDTGAIWRRRDRLADFLRRKNREKIMIK